MTGPQQVVLSVAVAALLFAGIIGLFGWQTYSEISTAFVPLVILFSALALARHLWRKE